MNHKNLLEASKKLRNAGQAGSLAWEAADYIEATVYKDDSEPVTQEWLASIGADVTTDKHRSYIRYRIAAEQLPMTLFVSDGEVFLNDRLIAFAETRGEFRALLRGLRVTINK